MKNLVGFLMMFALLAGFVVAQDPKSIGGKWNVKIDGDVGHHPPMAIMELEQDGRKVTGNFMIPEHGDLPLEGEYVNGKLTLHATEDGFMKLDIAAQLKDDGQLAGTLGGTMGDHVWIAERAKSR